MWRGTGGREPGRIGGGRGTGGGRREGGKRDFQSGGNGRKGEKFRNMAQQFTIEIEQRGANPYGRGWEAGVKGTGGGSFRPPCLPS